MMGTQMLRRAPRYISPGRCTGEGGCAYDGPDSHFTQGQTEFTEEAIAPQRCDPPPYTASRLNDIRDVDCAQEYGKRGLFLAEEVHLTRYLLEPKGRELKFQITTRGLMVLGTLMGRYFLSITVAEEASMARGKEDLGRREMSMSKKVVILD